MMIFSISQHPQAAGRAENIRAAMAHLAEAYEYIHDRRCSPWEFAVDIETLLAMGVTRSGLRWLTSKGYVDHACEVTTARDRTRKFRPDQNLAFPTKTCFLLTDAGAQYAAAMLGKTAEESRRHTPYAGPAHGVCGLPSTARPQWNAERRMLHVGQYVVKRYKLPSPNQEAVLAAFQEEGWPHHVDDPLPPQADQDPKCRLHDTIKRMNRHHLQRLVRFLGDGTGEGICWEFTVAASLFFPAAANSKSKLRRAA